MRLIDFSKTHPNEEACKRAFKAQRESVGIKCKKYNDESPNLNGLSFLLLITFEDLNKTKLFREEKRALFQIYLQKDVLYSEVALVDPENFSPRCDTLLYKYDTTPKLDFKKFTQFSFPKLRIHKIFLFNFLLCSRS